MKTGKCLLEIDIGKITGNYKVLQSKCSNSIIGASVKANAYGLGATKVALALQEIGCRDFFVATCEEGAALRFDVKGNILCLSGVYQDDMELAYLHNLTPVINHLEQLNLWRQLALKINKKLPCVLHFNTGINRLGIAQNEVEYLAHNPEALGGIEVKYIMSHLSASEDLDNSYNKEQLGKFKKYSQYFPNIPLSLANSSGIFLGPEYHFNLVRPGAAMYGINPTPQSANPMQNPVKLTAPIIQLRKLSKGESVGYGMTFTAEDSCVIATLPIGYADGYSRALGNSGFEMYIDGIAVPLIGRVSMDLITIDVTKLNPSIGREVEIIGDNCTPDKMANIWGTIGYEILTNLNVGKRFKVVYV